MAHKNGVKSKVRPRNDHHKCAKVLGGTKTDPPGNIARVDKKLHEAWHTVFPGYMTPHAISEEINENWIDPRYKMLVVSDEIYEKAKEMVENIELSIEENPE
jgi:hypothetical protein